MIQMINKLKKNQKGFTLVELIVVLVILAILAAFTIPTMLGFVDDARGKATVAEAREVYMAYQSAVTENGGTTETEFTANSAQVFDNATGVQAAALSKLSGDLVTAEVQNATGKAGTKYTINSGVNWRVDVSANKVSKVYYKHGDFLITIDYVATNSSPIIEKNKDIPTT